MSHISFSLKTIYTMAVIEEIVEEPTTSRPVDIDAQKIEPVVGADHEGDVFFESEEYPAEELQVKSSTEKHLTRELTSFLETLDRSCSI